MADIDIRVKATSEGIDNISKAADAIGELGDAATEAGGDGASTGLSWAAVAVGSFAGSLLAEGIKRIPEVVGDLYEAGKAASAAAAGFEAVGGKESLLVDMRDATGGLVTDTALMAGATVLMQANLSTSVGSVTEIIGKGGELGEKFKNDAAGGVKDLTDAIANIGNYKQVGQLGLDVDAVKSSFGELKKSMSDKDAWGMAIMEQVDTTIQHIPEHLDATHPHIEKFGTALQNFRDSAGKSFIEWLDEALGKLDNLFNGTSKISGQQADRQAVTDVGSRHGVDIDAQFADQVISLYRDGTNSIAAYNALVQTHGKLADEMLRSLGSRPAALDKLAEESSGFLPYYARFIPDYAKKSAGGVVQPEAPIPTTPHVGGGYQEYDPDEYSQPQPPTRGGQPATIEAPKVTRAEFDAIVAGANQATAATALFGVTAAAAMTSLSLSGLLAAGSLGLVASQAGSAVTQVRQLQTDLKALISLSINITASKQTGSTGGGDTTPARGPR